MIEVEPIKRPSVVEPVEQFQRSADRKIPVKIEDSKILLQGDLAVPHLWNGIRIEGSPTEHDMTVEDSFMAKKAI